MAKAAAVGAIESADGEGLYLAASGQRLFLGARWEEAKDRLSRSNGNLVAMHSLFAKAVLARADNSALNAEASRSVPVSSAAKRIVLAQAAEAAIQSARK